MKTEISRYAETLKRSLNYEIAMASRHALLRQSHLELDLRQLLRRLAD